MSNKKEKQICASLLFFLIVAFLARQVSSAIARGTVQGIEDEIGDRVGCDDYGQADDCPDDGSFGFFHLFFVALGRHPLKTGINQKDDEYYSQQAKQRFNNDCGDGTDGA